MPDLFHRAEHVGPGGIKCPCCGHTASSRTIRTRLKADLRHELANLDPPDDPTLADPRADTTPPEDQS